MTFKDKMTDCMGYWTSYPKHILLILGNEFCERFSFYGMRAILVIYLWNGIGLSQSASTSIYHAFLVVSYFTPIFGAIIADGWIGKYKTIVSVSMIYALGNIVMTVTAVPYGGSYMTWGPFVGLILIAIGTGGIKPCVSSFGGDQFEPNQLRQKDSFFSYFYVAINVGSLISIIITPIIRGDVYCFNDSCYVLAFGIPAFLMILAIILFIAGTKWYRIVPPGKSTMTRMMGCIWKALSRKCSCNNKERKEEHWLDYAQPEYDPSFILDVKDVTRVLWLFLPLPIFWTLYDQQGSRWTLQAAQMDGVVGSFTIQPDLVQALNPLLIVIIVPLLEIAIFPCLMKIKIPCRPLQRMVAGMILAAASFLIAAAIQAVIDKDFPADLKFGQTKIQIVNTAPCTVQFSFAGFDKTSLSSLQHTDYNYTASGDVTLRIDWTPCDKSELGFQDFNFTFREKVAYQLFICDNFQVYQYEQANVKQTDNIQSSIRFFNALDIPLSVKLKTTGNQEAAERNLGTALPYNVSEYDNALIMVNFFVDISSTVTNNSQRLAQVIHSKNGAVYTAILYNKTSQSDKLNEVSVEQITDISPWTTSVFLSIPQYIVISFGEALFSVTGLAFAYSQAPESMKSILAAAWLMTDAIGNVIVIIIEQADTGLSPIYEYILFAALMYATTAVFIVMTFFYDYVKTRKTDDEATKL